MIQKFNPEIQAVIEKISRSISGEVKIYLVGGAIRNLLLNLPIHDLDFIVVGPIKTVVRRVKQALNGKAFSLDDVRQTGRVIFQTSRGESLEADFVIQTGDNLHADLSSRDFTINAIAMDLQHPDIWIDPLAGITDLKSGILRCCSAQSMVLDPLRILRGLRFISEYGFKIDPGSYTLMKQEVPKLRGISGERIRDELFKSLQGNNPIKSLLLMDDLGVFRIILEAVEDLEKIPAHPPHISPLKQHTFRAVEILHLLITGLIGENEDIHNDVINKVIQSLQPYRSAYQQHFMTEFPDKRTRKGLILLGTLYHDTGKPSTITHSIDDDVHYYGHPKVSRELVIALARTLGLSNRESDYLACFVFNHMRIHQLANSLDHITDRAIFRYFRDMGDVGLDICLFSLADLIATFENNLTEDQLARELTIIISLVDSWNKRKQTVITPQRLLDGNDIMRLFNLSPGPNFSQILEALREAQAAGEVLNEEEAEQFVSDFLEKTQHNCKKIN